MGEAPPDAVTTAETVDRAYAWQLPTAKRGITLGPALAVFPVTLALCSGAMVLFRRHFEVALVLSVCAVAGVVLVRSLVRRWRDHAAARRAVAGATAWDADWTARRDVLTAGFLGQRLAPGASIVPTQLAVVLSLWLTTGGRSAIVLAFFAGTLACLAGCYLGWVALRGWAQVKLERFPYVPGESATFWIATTAGASRLEGTEVMLGCLTCPFHERCARPQHLEAVWSRSRFLPNDAAPGPDEFVPVTFELPAAAPGTSLHGDKLVRWELVVMGRTRWGRLTESFVVPVYAA